MFTNSNLNTNIFVLYEATLIMEALRVSIVTPRSVSDNTPTVLYSTREASTANPVVADILRTPALHSIKFFLNPYVFYHLGQ